MYGHAHSHNIIIHDIVLLYDII